MLFHRIWTGPGLNILAVTVAREPAGPEPGLIEPMKACCVHAQATLAAPKIMRAAATATRPTLLLPSFMVSPWN
ncbi:MAG TPA: hypothetical protein VNA57_09705 [Acidimicrobiales bacterium]|nr:hypothetical protein [Acidimicrobiales bacterium]